MFLLFLNLFQLLIQGVHLDFHISTSLFRKAPKLDWRLVMFHFGQAIAVLLKSTTLLSLDLSVNQLGRRGAEAWDPGEGGPDPSTGSSDRTHQNPILAGPLLAVLGAVNLKVSLFYSD